MPVIISFGREAYQWVGLTIQEVTHEADEIRRNNTELYDSNRPKQAMVEQARYFTPEQL